MKQSWWKVLEGFFLATALSIPAWAANPAVPGTLNYVEGEASIGKQLLKPNSVGSSNLETGQTLTTENGRAEVLLTPGVFLRLDDNSSVEMVSPGLTNTELRLENGRATVEVAEIHRGNDLRIAEDGATTQLLKTGLYDFDANRDQIRVFDGKAVVQDGGKEVKLKGGRELDLNSSSSRRAIKFNKKSDEDDFYRWSSLRSKYLAEANVDAAQIYMYNGWTGSGWYWDPWFDAYTFIPADGSFFSPFGWGFYSPLWAYRAPFYYGNYGGYYRHFEPDHRRWGREIAPDHDYARDFHDEGHSWGVRPEGGPGMGGMHGSGGIRWGGGFHSGGVPGGGRR